MSDDTGEEKRKWWDMEDKWTEASVSEVIHPNGECKDGVIAG